MSISYAYMYVYTKMIPYHDMMYVCVSIYAPIFVCMCAFVYICLYVCKYYLYIYLGK